MKKANRTYFSSDTALTLDPLQVLRHSTPLSCCWRLHDVLHTACDNNHFCKNDRFV